ncbi:hypothetical protein [Arsukibacterium sp.]|uniref:hypothetical protein n=1 Tax=Arsukibacterium sp. TaxID=1977258 RepID=UPI002FD8FCCA
MNIKSLLFSAWVVIFIISLPAANAEAAAVKTGINNTNFKTAVLDAYLKRCVEVLHSKSYSNQDIKAECTCELDYIDQHFDIFEQMLEGSQADNQQQINNFKKQLLQCKVKPE